jgi:RNA-directed DNA polymerase
MQFLRQASANSTRAVWALKLDVASFFPSIHKPTLYGILCRRIVDPELRWLVATILFHDPTADYVFHKGPRFVPDPASGRYPVEARKSLFGRDRDRGLPIGNLTSQFWANCYLNELDQFVKRELRCRHYVRYVDDLVLLAPDPGLLRSWHSRIRDFVESRLRLTLRTDGDEPFHAARGIDFAGWKTWPTYRVPRRRTLASLGARIRQAEGLLVRRDASRGIETIDLRVQTGRKPGSVAATMHAADALQSMLSSYSGHLRWGASRQAWSRIWDRHEWLESICARHGWDVRLRWTSRESRHAKFWRQYWALTSAAGSRTLLFCRVGAFVEFRGPFIAGAVSVLGLRRVRQPRGLWAFGAGFPATKATRYVRAALASGWSVAIAQEGNWRGRRACRARRVGRIVRPFTQGSAVGPELAGKISDGETAVSRERDELPG